MKRWVVVLLVALAVIVLVSPGIVGRLAEQSLKNSISWAQSESDDLLVIEETFERGWFTAEGRHRIELKKGKLRAAVVGLTGREDAEWIPALLVDTRIDHGLVPVTSMSRKSGSLMPGLASTVSTLQFDPGNGDLIEIPGALYSQVRLSGETVSQYLLEAGSFDDQEAKVEWDGADVSLTTDPSTRSIGYDGAIEPFSVDSGDDSFRLGATEFKGNANRTDFGLAVGSISLEMDSLSVGRPLAVDAATTTGFGKLTLDADSALDGDRVNGKSTMTIADVVVPGFGEIDMAIDVVLNGLDARSMQAIIGTLRDAQGADDPDAALAAVYPRIENDVQTFLSSGAEVRFDRLDVSLPHGEVTTKLSFKLPETAASGEFSWPALILALTASADIRVPVALMELAQSVNPQSGALIAMGILKKDGDFYVASAAYQKGLLTVNGAPMPIPLPVR
ncbi:MAG: DUF945 family protein [Woeseia sp.]